MAEVGVVDLLVAIERLVAAHSGELDVLNVFPVPDADTGRNVLATVRAARAGAEQAGDGDRRSGAVTGALQGARGNAGTLTSQLLRALVEAGDAGWPARLARADELARAAVAHPVEGSFLTATRAAAAAAAEHDAPVAQLDAATAAAHAAVRDSPAQLEVLARAGVVDAGARAAALVLEAVAAALAGTEPDPPAVEIPPGGPEVAGCEVDEAQFEVMYLLEPDGPEAADAVRAALPRLGGSVVVVAADRLVSVHVHTDDIGGVLDVGLAHGRPHHVRVEDLHEGTRIAAARGEHPATGRPSARRTGLVVGADGGGIARLAAATGAITLPVAHGATDVDADDVRRAIERVGTGRVVVLPGDPALAALAAEVAVAGVDVAVVAAADGPARVLAALAVLDPSAPDVDLLAEVAGAVRSGRVHSQTDGTFVAAVGSEELVATTVGEAVAALLGLLDRAGTPELVSLLVGEDAGTTLAEEAATAIEQHWPQAELDVVDVGVASALVVVGIE